MSEDSRCCGSGTCIIDAEDRCWCGRQWGGQEISETPLAAAPKPDCAVATQPQGLPTESD